MANYPDRCQHLKINGTQCGSPALRRNRFCYFHKRFQDESIRLSADRARRPTATFILPVLEDANSIQIALMQVMRLLVSGQIEHKIASLLLYALQTASANLRMTQFSPRLHEVILDPRNAADTPLESAIWKDADFEDEEEDEAEPDEVEIEAERAANVARQKVHAAAAARAAVQAQARKRKEDEEYSKKWLEKHPNSNLRIGEDGRLTSEPQPQPKKPPASATPDQIRADITGMVREHLPALAKTYIEATQQEKKGT